jgi:hypothetical protein
MAILAMASVSLAGCDSFNRAIGKKRVIPDEFQVVSNAPLAIPPDYTLRPPRVGGSGQDQSATLQARETVFRAAGDPQQASLPTAQNSRSPGEADLLRESGAANAAPDIRRTLENDPKDGVPFERSLVDKLVFWEGPTTPSSNDTIDPSQEASRIRLSQTAAKTSGPVPAAAANGETGTPTFDRATKKSSGWFDWLF